MSKSKNNRRNKNNRNQKQRGAKAVAANDENIVVPLESTAINAENVSTESNFDSVNEDGVTEVVPRKNNNRNNLRRGPNRRKPRNPDYQKPTSFDNSSDLNLITPQHSEDSSSPPVFETHSNPHPIHSDSSNSDSSSD